MLPMLIVFTFSLKLSFLLSLFVSSSAFVSEGFFFPIKANERPGLSKLEATKIGFVGFGTIANAIATGLATQDDIQLESISVTKRSEQKSKAFAEKFPSLVSVQDDSQKILDQADVIFVCVLPEQASQVLQDLSFDNSRHTLVSLVSTAKLDDLTRDSKLDPTNVSKMICLPSIARHQGVALHCSPTPTPFLTSLFEALGGVVTLITEKELEACMMTTCVMGPMYGIMREGRDWLLSNTDLSPEDASYLVIKQYIGAVLDTERDIDNPNWLDDLIAEQTPGGINAQALTNLDKLGALDAQRKMMDSILSRIRGESDGSV